MRSKRLVAYLDAGMDSFAGHHAEQCATILAALSRRSVRSRVVTFRQTKPNLTRVFRACPVLTVSTHPWNLLGTGWSAALAASAEQAVDVIVEDLETVRRFLRPALIYISTAQFPYVQAATRWLASLPPEDRPVVVIELQHELGVGITGSFPDMVITWPDRAVEATPWFFAQAGAEVTANPGLPLVLFAYDVRRAWLVSQVMSCPVETLAAPQIVTTSRRLRRRQKDTTFRIAFLGHQRWSKGYALIPEIVRSLLNSMPTAEFIIQNSSKNFSNYGADYNLTHDLVNLSRTSSNVQVLVGYCASEIYSSLLDLADIVVLPYDPVLFATNSSSVIGEAIANGIISVVPAGTTLDVLLDYTGGAGERFTEWTTEAICSAVHRAVDHFDTLAERAHQAAAHWQETQGPDRHVEQLLAIAARFGRSLS